MGRILSNEINGKRSVCYAGKDRVKMQETRNQEIFYLKHKYLI